MSRPWMPLYIGDYRRDTAHLGTLEHGAYLLLIMHYWQAGGLPNDDRQLARIACCTPPEWRRVRPTVSKFFGDGWASHKRLDAELAKSSDISSKRRAAAEQMHSKSKASAEQEHTPSQPPSQSESESKILDQGLFREGVKKPPKHGAVSADKRFIYFRRGTMEFAAYAQDYQEATGDEPEATKDGRWFKVLGEPVHNVG